MRSAWGLRLGGGYYDAGKVRGRLQVEAKPYKTATVPIYQLANRRYLRRLSAQPGASSAASDDAASSAPVHVEDIWPAMALRSQPEAPTLLAHAIPIAKWRETGARDDD